MKKTKGTALTYPSYETTSAYVFHNKKILTTEEVAAYTGHEISYIHKLSSENKIPHYNSPSGRKLFFLLDEIVEWCTTNKVKTVKEILQHPHIK